MKIKWEKNTCSWIGTAKKSYPRFEIWCSDNLLDNCWCLNITRGRYMGAIEVRDLRSLEDAKLFAEGSLEELDYISDSSLPVTVLCYAEDTQMTCAVNSVP